MVTFVTEIQALYVAYFNRPGDVAGLTFWNNAVVAGAATLGDIAAGFAASAEYIDTYEELSNDDKVALVYRNLFNREAEPAGLAYWSNALTLNLVTFDLMVTAVASGAQGSDLVAFQSKTTAAVAFTDALDTPQEASAYAGAVALDVARAYIAGVTSAATLAAAIAPAALAATVQSVVNAGEVFQLRAALDNLVGTGDDDVFWSSIGDPGSVTLSSGDRVDGGAGSADKLIVIDRGAAGTATPSGIEIRAIEIVSLDAVGNAVLDTTAGFDGLMHIDVRANGGLDISAGRQSIQASNHIVGNIATDSLGGDVFLVGGTTIEVRSTALQAKDEAAGANQTIYQATVDVRGTAATTAVAITQTASLTQHDTVIAVKAVLETTTATFSSLGAGESVTVGGLRFTAGAGGTSAAETAAAFAGLGAGATQGHSVKGSYSGVTGAFTSSEVSALASVVFSAAVPGNQTDILFSASNVFAAPLVSVVQGRAEVAAAGNGGIGAGYVAVFDEDGGTTSASTITTVSVDGYSGGFVRSNALTSLSLANGNPGNEFEVQAVLGAAGSATTLALHVNHLAGSSIDLDGDDQVYTRLNLTTGSEASSVNILANAVTDLTVAGETGAALWGSQFGALRSVTVSGSAGVQMDVSSGNVDMVDTSAATGFSAVVLDAAKTSFTGGAGDNSVITAGTTVSKPISFGSGNDSVYFADGTTSVTAPISGGSGYDGILLLAADAVRASASAAFATQVTGFEVLRVTGATGLQTIDIAALGGYREITAVESAGTLTLNNMANNSMLNVAGNTTGIGYIVNLQNALSNSDDVFNLVLTPFETLVAGTVRIDHVETINLEADNDFNAFFSESLTLAATHTSTLNIGGSVPLMLSLAGSGALTVINAASMKGNLSLQSMNTASATAITGGSGADILMASTGATADVIRGGGGNDTLVSNAGLVTLYGGAGDDLFHLPFASASAATFTTIADAGAGDRISLRDNGVVETFRAGMLSLGVNASFLDYANAAANAGATGTISWFQFGGDTYLVQSGNDNLANNFVGGSDQIVKLVGTLDLSTASLNVDGGATLLLA